jgi:hypothetical protein
VALRPGVPWSESLTGTNAIGTARPVRAEDRHRGAAQDAVRLEVMLGPPHLDGAALGS